MTFNELNSVEHFIIHNLTGVNLNSVHSGMVRDGYGVGVPGSDFGSLGQQANWKYVRSELLQREITDVLVEKELINALCRLNPEIAAQPERADEVIRKLRAILISVGNVGLVRANEEFARWLKGEVTLPYGKNENHVPVRLIDFENASNNSFILTNQFKFHARETKIPDIVMLVNGIPLVIGEAKTPARPAISWLDGAHDIHVVYENAVPQLFVPNVFSFATEGKEVFIGGVRTSLEFWSPWRIEDERDELLYFAGLQDVAGQLSHLLKPSTLLDILQHFTLYATDNKKKKIKVVCRYQQYEGTNAIVERVLAGEIKKGLIWNIS
jgi:type I restriction enzyme R subunit